ncbi:MAG: hypothetical protein WCT47_22470, partial [Betaproteobacteria bacterium]
MTAPHAAVLASAAAGQAHRGRPFCRHLLPGADDLELRRIEFPTLGTGEMTDAGACHRQAGVLLCALLILARSTAWTPS